jgi:hypothetical protein
MKLSFFYFKTPQHFFSKYYKKIKIDIGVYLCFFLIFWEYSQ